MYNSYNKETSKETKKMFIDKFYYDVDTQKTIVNTFDKIAEVEESFKKDLYDFNEDQVKDMLRYMNCPTVNALGRNFHYAKQYVKWVTKKGYCSPNTAFMNIFRKDLQLYINKDAASNQHIKNRDELYELCDKLANPVDRALLVSFYEGLNGEEMKEVRYLEKQDVKFISNFIEVRYSNNPRIIANIDQRTMDILKEAIEEDIYYNNNGESEAKAPTRKLMDSPYVIRPIKMHNTVGDAISDHGIYVKFDKIKKWTEKYYINSTNIFYSGMFEKLEKIESEKGELGRLDYHEVLKISGMNPETWGLLKENYLVFKSHK